MNDAFVLSETFEFAASHRLHLPDATDAENRAMFGKCNNPNGHGHNYRIEVSVEVSGEVAGAAEAAGKALFAGEVASLDARTLEEVAEDLPCTVLEPGELGGDGIAVLDLLPRTTLAASKREARDFLAAGAVMVNGSKASADARLTPKDLLHGRVALLRRGKKNWHAVRPG